MKLPLLANESKGWRKLSLTGFCTLVMPRTNVLVDAIKGLLKVKEHW
ncbi:hypothetical protein Plhal304r1_c061g0148231 [Plasmopara halstedii]